jgi:hypothetical protein
MADELKAASTIAGWARCLRTKLKVAGRGEQNAEMLLVSKVEGELRFDDLGGWAQRNASMERIIRAADAALEPLPNFQTLVVQTGDRCIVKRIRSEPNVDERLELDLWQKQPLSAEQHASLPLGRVLSMCCAPSYADVAVPDWACDAWTEAGLGSNYDETCAELAAAGARPAPDARVCWFGTTHHHPCRLRLVDLARAHPELIMVNNVYWTQDELAASVDAAPTTTAPPASRGFMSMADQLRTFALCLDVQGKGYSSRVKFLLHSGRPLLLAKRPWVEHYHSALRPWQHYIPVREDLADLAERVRWAHAHPADAARIAAEAQQFARERLTSDALLREWRTVLTRMSASPSTLDPPSADAQAHDG